VKPITDSMLRGACRKQRAVFRKEWPSGAPVTVKAALRAVALGLDVTWLARLLSVPLWAEYQRQVAPLWAEYERQVAPLFDEYQRQEAPLWAEYKRQEARVLVPLLRKVKP